MISPPIIAKTKIACLLIHESVKELWFFFRYSDGDKPVCFLNALLKAVRELKPDS
jgi:hypothetical protein